MHGCSRCSRSISAGRPSRTARCWVSSAGSASWRRSQRRRSRSSSRAGVCGCSTTSTTSSCRSSWGRSSPPGSDGAGNAVRVMRVDHDVTDRIPALYLGHGAPPLLDDPVWPGELAGWANDLPRPKAILIVSAHWEESPLTIGATSTVPLVYDFYGFPERYYQVTYPAPGAPWLETRQADALLHYPRRGPGLLSARPTVDPYVPLSVSLAGSLDKADTGRTVIDGYFLGLSKRSLQFE